jgi:hypothetical protein
MVNPSLGKPKHHVIKIIVAIKLIFYFKCFEEKI